MPTITLDGVSLTTDALLSCSRSDSSVRLSAEAISRISDARAIVDKVLESNEIVYGINTGFGLFANVTVPDNKLIELQENLIRSHAAGCGDPLTRERTRMLLALRINVLAKGHSGITLRVVQQMVDALNADCIPVVPCKGSVGASGDLAPLAHLALGLMGEGPMWQPGTDAQGLAADVLAAAGLSPIQPKAKEGLAMINGTQMIAALGAEAIERAARVARLADYVAALSLEVLFGTVRAFNPLIHDARPHPGQRHVASRVRAVVRPEAPSELFQSHRYVGKVQDAYSLRCVPQVHGVAHDTIAFCRNILNVELNSATDNPMCFTQAQVDAAEPWCFGLSSALPPLDVKRPSIPPIAGGAREVEAVASASHTSLDAANREIAQLRDALKQKKERERDESASAIPNRWTFHKKESDTLSVVAGSGLILSGGNFHGEYPAKALDFLAIATSELASISERRIERLCNPSLSGLPAFLVAEGGLNSGFMIAHCTAAALVAENRVLSHPASVDSISTSAAKEDHVSMGAFAARKALEIVENVETVIAIELLAACQGIDLHRPLKTTPPLEALHALVRRTTAPWVRDRQMAPDIKAVHELVRSGAALEAVESALSE